MSTFEDQIEDALAKQKGMLEAEWSDKIEQSSMQALESHKKEIEKIQLDREKEREVFVAKENKMKFDANVMKERYETAYEKLSEEMIAVKEMAQSRLEETKSKYKDKFKLFI